jgi:hypothetical protein
MISESPFNTASQNLKRTEDAFLAYKKIKRQKLPV